MKYILIIQKSFKSQFSYTAATVTRLLGSMLTLFIQASLWNALIQSGGSNGTTLPEMMAYVTINLFVLTLTSANIASELEPSIRDGSVANYFVRPVSFKYYCFSEMLGKNIYATLTTALPVLLLGFLFFSFPLPGPLYAMLFLLSLLLGCVIIYELTYIFGLLAFFTQRAWYLSWYLSAFLTLFGGTAVPLWFYPGFLISVGNFLPFRYITYQPIEFFLERIPVSSAFVQLSVAAAWIVILNIISQILYRHVEKRLSINGG